MATQPHGQSITPAWKVFTAIGFAGVVGAAVTYFRDGSTLAIIGGMVILAIGLPLTVWSFLRMLRENRGHRLHWWRTPPVNPRNVDLSRAVGIPTTIFGALAIWLNTAGSAPWWLAAIFTAILIALFGATVAVHNLRLSQRN
ncbi:hypothetical protein [Rhodococcus erythropolis]|uniref:hypothetical protein n=1 Tax=Rhodococcus erythropolis TaxID=1833 RepID=UPI003F67F8D0